MPRKRKAMNEDAFVEDFASGLYTQKQLAEKYGISLPLVKKIASGQRRPDLHERIEEAREAHCRQTQQQLVGLLDAAVGALRNAMAGPPAPALAAAREVFNRVLGKPDAAGAVRARAAEAPRDPWCWPDFPSLVDLSPETKRLVLKELGGPSPDDHGYGPMYAEEPTEGECIPDPIASEGTADQ